MPTIKGVGLRFGTGLTATGIVIAENGGAVQSSNVDRTADKAELRDKNNDVIGVVYSNLMKTIRITVKPMDSATPTEADAKTNLDAMLKAAGTTMVLTAYDNSANVIAEHSGNFNVDATHLVESIGEVAAVEIEATQHDANDTTAAVA